MAYYYVKNGGTATGDAGRYATQQTGSFAGLGAAGYYNDLESAVAATTPPTGGDYIMVSDLHLHTYSGTKTIDFSTVAMPTIVMSVDDSNVDSYRTGSNRGKEIVTNGNSLTLKNASFLGMAFECGRDLGFSFNSNVQDCYLEVTGSGDNISPSAIDASYLDLKNTEIKLANAGGVMRVTDGSILSIDNVTFTTDAASITNMFNGGWFNAGGMLRVVNCDLTMFTGTLIANIGSSLTVDDMIMATFHRCKLASGVAYTNESFSKTTERLIISQCSDSDAAAEYQYHIHTFGGDLNEDTSVYRGEDAAFPISNQKISYEIVTNTDASLAQAFWFDFPDVKGVDLSAGAGSDKISLSITSDTTLTDKDIYMEVSYPDGTNYATSNTLTTAPQTVGGGFDVLATGTTLTTDTGSTWTGGKLNEYILTVDTSTNAGAKCAPSIRVYVTKPSTTLYISSEPQVS